MDTVAAADVWPFPVSAAPELPDAEEHDEDEPEAEDEGTHQEQEEEGLVRESLAGEQKRRVALEQVQDHA